MTRRRLFAVLTAVSMAALPLAACLGPSEVQVRASGADLTGLGEPLPGRYALSVDGDDMDEIEGSLSVCAMSGTKIDSAAALREAARTTFGGLVEELVVEAASISRYALAERGYDGQIVVTAESVDVDFQSIGTFWQAQVKVEVGLTVGMRVDGPDGRLLGKTASAEAEVEAEPGGFCLEAPEPVGVATAEVIDQTLRELGEAFATSPRLRETRRQSAQHSR